MMRYILKNINVLNLLLAGLLVALLNYALYPLMGKDIRIAVSGIKKSAAPAEKPPAKDSSPDTADYLSIAEKNLFHPDRVIPVEKKAEEKPLPKPDFVLYGTLIDGATRLAFMDDLKTPYTTPGRGKRQRVISQGSNLSGYALSEVHEDRIVMARGDDKITVRIDDMQHKRSGPVDTTAPAVAAPAAGRKPAQTPSTPRTARPAQQTQQPQAQQPQPFRQYQPDSLRRSMRSIKQQPPRTITQPARPAQPSAPDNNDED